MGGDDHRGPEADELRTSVDDVPPDYLKDVEGRLPNGFEIDGYVVDGVLGKGGMGVVYSATHRMIGKRAAIKVLRTEVSQNPVTVERFIQEARAVNQIAHPNIIDIFDFGTLPDGRAYHLMDLMTGESLRKRLRRGPLHPSEAASVIEGVTSALMAAHDKGFVHRDLKPDNVYLIANDNGWPEVKLLDFGLAKLMPEAGAATFMTKTGVMLGTPEYMSPEQARGLPVDYRTDVYALGIVMFEILCGQRPFPSMGGDSFAMLQCHAEEPPPSLESILPELPQEMVQLVDAMLAKEPAARPSLAAVRTVIKRLRTTKLPTASVAGVEMASYSNPQINVPGGNASHLGATPMVPAYQQQAPSLPPPPSLAPQEDPVDIMPTAPRRVSGLGNAAQGSSPPAANPKGVHGSTRLGVAPPPKLPPTQLVGPAKQKAAVKNTWLIVGALLALLAGVALAIVLVGI